MFSLSVGVMGTMGTIINSLRGQYSFDSRAEQFRLASADYHQIVLKLKVGSKRAQLRAKHLLSLSLSLSSSFSACPCA